MNFNSLSYLIFLAANIAVYYVLPFKVRNIWLLLSSYFFYMCWNPKYALLILFSTAVTFFCGLLTEKEAGGKKKLWLVLSLIVNLLILFFFKYFNFLSGLISDGHGSMGLSLRLPTLDLLLPVGISFYTFQALGYTMDVYRKKVDPEKNFVDYALFVSFFPQLVAGPIERSGNMLHQLKEKHAFQWENLRDGALPVLWGLLKKMVLADNLAVLVNTVYNAPEKYSGGEFLIATVAFAFQIYCDFSAYSDIARGSAKMLGFTLMENFRCPYFAVSIQDFWRRWHISLSSWFKDYLYFPLGGSRCSKWRHRLNLMIVFVVSGLWHGAALNFIFWGMLNGLYQVISAILRPVRDKALSLLRTSRESPVIKSLSILFTFCLTCVTWVLFRANSMSDAGLIFGKLFSAPFTGEGIRWDSLGISVPTIALMLLFVILLGVVDWLIHNRDLPKKLNSVLIPRYAVYFLLIVFILLFGSYGEGYDPQDFVYFQF